MIQKISRENRGFTLIELMVVVIILGILALYIGPTTKAAAVFLRYGLNIPHRKVKELFEVFFNWFTLLPGYIHPQ